MKTATHQTRPAYRKAVASIAETPTAQHTPGPWEVQRDDSVETYRIWGEPNRDRHLIVCSLGAESKCAIANARLIAAAPDLLAALQQIKTVADLAIASPIHSARYMQDVEILASAAIAKARA